jgi:hypothetical protein
VFHESLPYPLYRILFLHPYFYYYLSISFIFYFGTLEQKKKEERKEYINQGDRGVPRTFQKVFQFHCFSTRPRL